MTGIFRGTGTSGTGIAQPDVLTRVAIAGDTMTGYLNVPAGATGTQAPQSQEVTHVTTLAAAGGALLVGNTPAGNIAATTVQAALNELDTEKALLAGLSTQVFSAAAATAVAHVTRADQIQNQTITTARTSGTSTAYTLSLSPAITAYVTGQEFNIVFNAACGASPTINVNGIGAVNLVDRLVDGTYYNIPSGRIPAEWRSKCVMVSLTQMLVDTPCESVSSTVALASAISLTNNVSANVTSISIPAGDWEVFGNVIITPAVGTTKLAVSGSTSSTSATFAGENSIAQILFGSTGLSGVSFGDYLSLPTRIVHLSVATTHYLVASASFSASTMTAAGTITARRYK